MIQVLYIDTYLSATPRPVNSAQTASQLADLQSLRQAVTAAQSQLESRDLELHEAQQRVIEAQQRVIAVEVQLSDVETERNYIQKELEIVKSRLSRNQVNSIIDYWRYLDSSSLG